MKYFESIRFMIISTILIILIPLIEFEFFNINQIYDHQAKNELDSKAELGQAIAATFLNYVEGSWDQESILGAYIAANPQLSQEEICSYLGTAKDAQETAKSYCWVNPEGIIVGCSTNDLLGLSIKNADFIKKIISGEEKAISDLIRPFGIDEPILPVARAIRKDGKLKGIMIATIDMSKLKQLFSNLNLQENDIFGLIDTNGMAIYSSDNPLIFLKQKYLTDNESVLRALAGLTVKAADRNTKYEGKVKLYIQIPIKQIGWVCSISSSYDVGVKGYYKEARDTIIMFAFIIIFSIGACLLLGFHILRPINLLKNTAQKIMNGDYSCRTNISGYDEIAVTAQAFDRMAEGIEQYDRFKTQFFSNLSHDLKTPINVIYAASQLLESEHEGATDREYKSVVSKFVKVIKQNCFRQQRLINNLIDISKSESGYLKMRSGNYNIVSLTEDITLSIVKYAEHKGINLIFDTDTEEKAVICDPDMIERIMLNLLSNAIKFTDKYGSIFVNVYDKGDKIEISVRDTGIGIPEDKLDIIFERFRQVDSSLYRNREGSGIGLSLVKALVEAHKGRISVNSKLGEGTEFIVELPAASFDENDSPAQDSSTSCQNKSEKVEIEFSDIYSPLD